MITVRVSQPFTGRHIIGTWLQGDVTADGWLFVRPVSGSPERLTVRPVDVERRTTAGEWVPFNSPPAAVVADAQLDLFGATS